MIRGAIIFALAALLFSCKKEYYKYVQKTCVQGYYKTEHIGGKMLDKPTMDCDRIDSFWVCTKYTNDTISSFRWVFK